MHTNHTALVTATLDFLGLEELTAMAEVDLAASLDSRLFKVATAKAFMGNYLNRVDRGVFFTFYDDQDFRCIEKNTINVLASHSYPFLVQAYQAYQTLFQAFSAHSSFLAAQPDFCSMLEQMFLEPDLPMPKFKRESIGMFCETGIQEHVCLIRFPP
jgi:hypothetical protein